MKSKLLLAGVVIAAIALISGVYFIWAEQQRQQEEADRAAAEANLQKMMDSKAWADTQAAMAESWAREQEEQAARKAAIEAAKPHYHPQRLAMAAKPKVWAAITVPDINLKAVLNTIWKDGCIYYRVAFLGHPRALQLFTSSYDEYQVNFQNSAGSQIFAFRLKPSDFVMDPPTVNNGIPTMETNNAVECDLPIYEEFRNWNLVWNI